MDPEVSTTSTTSIEDARAADIEDDHAARSRTIVRRWGLLRNTGLVIKREKASRIKHKLSVGHWKRRN
jgi:hypothetical protein